MYATDSLSAVKALDAKRVRPKIQDKEFKTK